LALLAGQKVVVIEVDIDKSIEARAKKSEANPYSNSSANRANLEQEGVKRRPAAA